MAPERSRAVAGLVAGLAVAMLTPSPALADPAGPTDYRSEVVDVAPPTATIDVRVIGGDSFVELTVDDGTDVVVVGYRGEPYLWFRDDGRVFENRNSPSTYTNADRFGGGEIPPTATPDAEPEWDQVGDGGRWAWHDHRAHWMQRIRPVGRAAGDQILEAVIPLRVDGTDVDVTVISTWRPPASSIPVWLGALVGASAVALSWRRRGSVWAAVAVASVGALALVAGVWQYSSLPAETGPRSVWWLLPALAFASASVAALAARRGARLVAEGALLLAGVELLTWGLIKRDGLDAALIPTDAPGWFDRLATSAALAAGIGVAIVALFGLFAVSGPRERSGSRRPALR